MIDLSDAYENISFEEDLSDVFWCDGDADDRFPAPALSEKRLILMHTGRCGSTLLHHALLAQNICPPFEIFNKYTIEPVLKEMGCRPPVNIYDYVYTYRLMMLGRHINAVDAVVSYSVNPWSLSWLTRRAPSLLRWMFDDAFLVILNRRNIVRQAISYVAASAGGRWHSYEQESSENHVDNVSDYQTKLDEFLDFIQWAEQAIRMPPLSTLVNLAKSCRNISYESLANGLYEVSSLISEDVGVAPVCSKDFCVSNLPSKLDRDEDIFNTFWERLPVQLPSGMAFTKQTLYARLLA